MATFPADDDILSSADLGLGMTSWTPTLSGVTAGLTVSSAKYWVSLGIAHFEVYLNCTAGLTGSALAMSLPVSIATLAWTTVGDAVLNPNGTRYWGKVLRGATDNEVWVKYLGTAGQPVDIAAAAPATWSARSQAVACRFSAPLA